MRRHPPRPVLVTMMALSLGPWSAGAQTSPEPAAEASAPASAGDGARLKVREARRALFDAGREAQFRPTTLIERATAEALIPVLVDRARRGETRVRDLRPLARAARLEVLRWTVGDAQFLVLREVKGAARGAGAYVFRVGPPDGPRELVLQAPHAYFDLYTGRIATGMFFGKREGRRARALFVNTLQRYERGDVDRDSPADVCHRPEHLFSVITDRTLRALGPSTVIQLHGFGQENVPPGVRAIVSAGEDRLPSTELRAIADGVSTLFGRGVRLYPTDIDRLGGTTNVQGRLAALMPDARFVHLELSKGLRERLRKTPRIRHKLARVLFEPERPLPADAAEIEAPTKENKAAADAAEPSATAAPDAAPAAEGDER